jgi:hypothetical protein
MGLQGHIIFVGHINAFVLVPVHTTAYCRHVATNCVAFIEGVRINDSLLIYDKIKSKTDKSKPVVVGLSDDMTKLKLYYVKSK